MTFKFFNNYTDKNYIKLKNYFQTLNKEVNVNYRMPILLSIKDYKIFSTHRGSFIIAIFSSFSKLSDSFYVMYYRNFKNKFLNNTLAKEEYNKIYNESD